MSNSVIKAENKKVTESEKATKYLAEVSGLATKSAQIRALSAKGLTRGQIAGVLGIRYQHVRNVLITPVKTPKV